MRRFVMVFVAFLATFIGGCDLELRGGSGALAFIRTDFMSYREAEVALRDVVFPQWDIYIRMPDKNGMRRAALLSEWMKQTPRPKPYLDAQQRIQIFSRRQEWNAEMVFAECFRRKGSRITWDFSRVVKFTISPLRMTRVSVHFDLNLLATPASSQTIYKPPVKAPWYKPPSWRPVGGSGNERRYCD